MNQLVVKLGRFLKHSLVSAVVLGFAGVASITRAQTPGNFVPTGNMTTPRADPTATLLPDGRVLIVGGGIKADGSSLASAELYDPAAGTFSSTGSMNTGREGNTATLLNSGKVLIAGGDTGFFPPFLRVALTSAELYDPATGQFTLTGSMVTPRSGHQATLLQDGRVLIAGGDLVDYGPGTSAELYDPATGTFSATGSRTIASWDATPILLEDGKVLFVNADIFSGNLVASELYDPANGTFTNKNSGIPSSYWQAASLLADRRVLITGGGEFDTFGVTYANSELYDPATGKFMASGNMSTPRVLHTSTLLPDGTVLVAGGYSENHSSFSLLSSAELYDPATGRFRTTGSMTASRYGHTATPLKNGKVLITGGGGAFSPASAELYDPSATQPGHVAPWLFSVSQDGTGQGSILHAGTARPASASDPASAGEALEIYCSGLDEATGAPVPEVTIGGQPATVLYFGGAPGYPGLDQVNVAVPSGVAAGSAVSVVMKYHGLFSNVVTIGVR